MTKDQDKIWDDKFKKNETVFVYDDFEDIVLRFIPNDGKGMICYAKRKGKEEYEIDWTTNLVMNARLGGEIVDGKFYNSF